VGNVKGAAAEVRKAVKLLDVLNTGYLRVGAPHVASAGRGLGVWMNKVTTGWRSPLVLNYERKARKPTVSSDGMRVDLN